MEKLKFEHKLDSFVKPTKKNAINIPKSVLEDITTEEKYKEEIKKLLKIQHSTDFELCGPKSEEVPINIGGPTATTSSTVTQRSSSLPETILNIFQ